MTTEKTLLEVGDRRTWNDLSDAEKARVKRLLTPDPDDNLADLEARCERALQIIRGEKP